MSDSPKVRLSASRIKTAQDCSWRYYASYHLKLPDKGNPGSGRGSCCHPVLEALLRPDRRKYYDRIMKSKDVFCVPSIARLVMIHARKNKVDDEENLALINKFILAGLEIDFYCEGSISVQSELKFEENDGRIWFMGFIDKIAEYEDRVLLIDYKTQAKHFSDYDLEFSIQALMYLMVARKKYPKKNLEFEFHQLKEQRDRSRKVKNPVQKVTGVSNDVLDGFYEWLCELSSYLEDFDIKKATSNFASRSPSKINYMCGTGNFGDRKDDGSLKHQCSAKFPFIYFALVEGDKTIKTAYTKKELVKELKPGQKIQQKNYEGCPAWKHLWEKKTK